MSRPAYQFAFVALLLWLLGSWLGAHGHFCFDGQEPPISVHVYLEGLHDHEHHPDDAAHQDTDVELTQLAIAKFSKIDLGLALLAVLALLIVLRPQGIIANHYRVPLPPKTAHIWPPLRAPPAAA